jgi:hypothetical protein
MSYLQGAGAVSTTLTSADTSAKAAALKVPCLTIAGRGSHRAKDEPGPTGANNHQQINLAGSTCTV